MAQFKDGSLRSKSDVEYHGVVAYHFDSNYMNGSKDEYSRNLLKGLPLQNIQLQVSPVFDSLQTDGDDNFNGSYTAHIIAVIIKKAIVSKGVVTLPNTLMTNALQPSMMIQA